MEVEGTFLGIMALGVMMFLYLLPAIIASERNHRNAAPILVLNIVFGWTLLGWIVSLMWALTYQERTKQ